MMRPLVAGDIVQINKESAALYQRTDIATERWMRVVALVGSEVCVEISGEKKTLLPLTHLEHFAPDFA